MAREACFRRALTAIKAFSEGRSMTKSVDSQEGINFFLKRK